MIKDIFDDLESLVTKFERVGQITSELAGVIVPFNGVAILRNKNTTYILSDDCPYRIGDYTKEVTIMKLRRMREVGHNEYISDPKGDIIYRIISYTI